MVKKKTPQHERGLEEAREEFIETLRKAHEKAFAEIMKDLLKDERYRTVTRSIRLLIKKQQKSWRKSGLISWRKIKKNAIDKMSKRQ
jgi:hypothetical protein